MLTRSTMATLYPNGVGLKISIRGKLMRHAESNLEPAPSHAVLITWAFCGPQKWFLTHGCFTAQASPNTETKVTTTTQPAPTHGPRPPQLASLEVMAQMIIAGPVTTTIRRSRIWRTFRAIS